MANITEDIRDAILEAQAEIMDAMREIAEEILLPKIKRAKREMLHTRFTPEDIDKLREEQPDLYQELTHKG